MTFPTGRAVALSVGLILSTYAVYVEYKMQQKDESEEFVALCDIAALNASCSTVFTLPVGRMLSYFGLVPEHSLLDLPNAALGMIFYTFMLVSLPFASSSSSLLTGATNVMVAGAMASSVFLAYQLTFVLYELCVLCWSTHAINSFVFYRQFFASTRETKPKLA